MEWVVFEILSGADFSGDRWHHSIKPKTTLVSTCIYLAKWSLVNLLFIFKIKGETKFRAVSPEISQNNSQNMYCRKTLDWKNMYIFSYEQYVCPRKMPEEIRYAGLEALENYRPIIEVVRGNFSELLFAALAEAKFDIRRYKYKNFLINIITMGSKLW